MTSQQVAIHPVQNAPEVSSLAWTYIKLILTGIFWGGTFIAGRYVAQDIQPFSATFLRFLIASLCMLGIIWQQEGRLPALKRHQVAPVILSGLTGVVAYNVFFFQGLKYIEAGRAALIIALNPVMISLMSALIFKESLSRLKILGIAFSVSGALVVVSRGELHTMVAGGIGTGEGFIFLCVLSWVTYSLLGKRLMSDLSPLVAVTYSCMVGALGMLIPAWREGVWTAAPYFSVRDWLGLFYLGFFGTVLAFVWYYQGIRQVGAARTSVFINFVPISAVVMAYFLLQEPITLSLLIGAVLVSTGVTISNLKMAQI